MRRDACAPITSTPPPLPPTRTSAARSAQLERRFKRGKLSAKAYSHALAALTAREAEASGGAVRAGEDDAAEFSALLAPEQRSGGKRGGEAEEMDAAADAVLDAAVAGVAGGSAAGDGASDDKAAAGGEGGGGAGSGILTDKVARASLLASLLPRSGRAKPRAGGGGATSGAAAVLLAQQGSYQRTQLARSGGKGKR